MDRKQTFIAIAVALLIEILVEQGALSLQLWLWEAILCAWTFGTLWFLIFYLITRQRTSKT